MRRYWPHDSRFDEDNFGYQPTWLILQALQQGAKLRGEDLHLQELGIATLSALFVNANRDPRKGEPSKPEDFYHFKLDTENQIQIDPIAADCFFALVNDSKLPQWALNLSPLDKLRASRKEGSAPLKNRAWMKRGVLLLLPKITGTKVSSPLAIVDGVDGVIPIINIDSGSAFQVKVPNPNRQKFWQVDVQYEIVAGKIA